MLVPAMLLVLSCAAALASEPPLPSGPQIAVPEPRLGKGGDCSSACEVCGCDREVDIDRGGNDVGPRSRGSRARASLDRREQSLPPVKPPRGRRASQAEMSSLKLAASM